MALKKDYEEINDFSEEEDDIVNSSDESVKYEHYRFIADKGQGLLRIDKFLSDRIEGISRNRSSTGGRRRLHSRKQCSRQIEL